MALTDADDISIEEANVLGLVPFREQGEEVELCSDRIKDRRQASCVGAEP